MAVAYCFRSGEVEVGRSAPDGAIALIRGPAAPLRKAVKATARHAYDGKTLLVPGVPEQDDDDAALDAAAAWAKWVARRASTLRYLCAI